MDFHIHNIKTFVCLVFAPDRHTIHKTMREPCRKHGQVLRWVNRLKAPQSHSLGGLLNEYLMAVDFTNYRETDRLFLFICHRSDCRKDCSYCGDRLIYHHLTAWQCYIAKYP